MMIDILITLLTMAGVTAACKRFGHDRWIDTTPFYDDEDSE